MEIDVVVISTGRTAPLREMTQNCINSLYASEKHIVFNVLVLDDFCDNYTDAKTIHPGVDFNYAAWCNVGIKNTQNSFICITNNDVIFYPGWASKCLKVLQEDTTLGSVSAWCPETHPKYDVPFNSGLHYGYTTINIVTGWCILHRRSVLNILVFLTSNFLFGL